MKKQQTNLMAFFGKAPPPAKNNENVPAEIEQAEIEQAVGLEPDNPDPVPSTSDPGELDLFEKGLLIIITNCNWNCYIMVFLYFHFVYFCINFVLFLYYISIIRSTFTSEISNQNISRRKKRGKTIIPFTLDG